MSHLKSKFQFLDAKNHIYLQEVTSTNTVLKDEKYPAGTCMTAATQTAGRGRKNHNWEHLGQNLTFSGKISWQGFSLELPLFSLYMGEAVRNACNKFLGKELCQVKWPNDVYCNHKKIAGILLETSTNGEKYSCIIGVGINLYSEHIPNDLPQAACLSNTALDASQKERLLASLVEQINSFLALLLDKEDHSHTISRLYKHSYLKNKEVITTCNGETVRAKVNGYTPQGFLQISAANSSYELMDSPEKFEVC
ncbi:MAG: biotin--[acetyl-CoA-carboxylase] ligase [Spirochaetota bacterium]